MERLLQRDLQYSGEQAKAQVAFIPNKSDDAEILTSEVHDPYARTTGA